MVFNTAKLFGIKTFLVYDFTETKNKQRTTKKYESRLKQKATIKMQPMPKRVGTLVLFFSKPFGDLEKG